ncbi:response regulator [Bacillus sp. 3255]|uniref:response regulator n=1 Tax=Bacillus sp. 3255 TaxID=2817904 RepID=UPI00285A58CC|nr:response regulator [Bacillus sp. 3255]MDR6881271.1 two-component system response regulator YesN [Bacillus sp. 3255]
MYKALLVDDEYMIKLSLTKLIQDQGDRFQVVGEAEDGEEALQLIEQLRPNLVITDIRMPGLNGLELVELAKNQYPETEFIIVSGYEEFDYARKALRLGVSDYLLKPLVPEQVYQVLRTVYDKFENRSHTRRLRQSWIHVCSMEAKQLTVQIELLNRLKVEDCLESIQTKWMELERDLGAESLYADMIAVLAEELALSREEVEQVHIRPVTVEQAVGHLRIFTQEVMGKRREARNWGVRQQITKAEQYISSHYTDETLSLQQVAEHVGLSPAYLSTLFKENLGTSFIQFVTKLRMEQACRLLADPTVKTYEAANAVGYSDYPYFNKAFKKNYGVSPTEFRKNMGFF